MRIPVFVLLSVAGAVLGHAAEVTDKGLWLDSEGQAVSAFGINYAPMFAHSYRRIEQLGMDHKEAIDQDVYHFVRMGLNAYRIHVWDIEISDSEGNLLVNKHLDLLDYLVFRLRQHGIDILMTPLFLGENGWPEKPTGEPGFASGHHKKEFVTDKGFAEAQRTYLRQFLEHVNPYTGTAYKDEPAIIGIELVNEPWHEGGEEAIAAHLDSLKATVKDTGCVKPIFYCMSQNPYLRELYYEREFDGYTFQWYPAGLSGSPKSLNLLPQVNSYPLFFDEEPEFRNSAKAFYEFSLASVPTAYAYPKLAETIRDQGFQFAAYFSYDPMAIGAFNSEYPMHFMNLAYTPKHAINLMIAAEVFRGEREWSADAESNQSLLNNGELYYYSNETSAPPVAVDRLQRIAGYGSSPIVHYDGKGAYFLDKLEDGVWRLEVMPDAMLLVENPYWYRKDGSPVADVAWREHSMSIDLPDLTGSFRIDPLTNENCTGVQHEGRTFRVSPGVYLLTADGGNGEWKTSTNFHGYPLAHFVAPPSLSEAHTSPGSKGVRPAKGAGHNMLFDANRMDRPSIIRSQNSDRLIEQESFEDGAFNVSVGPGRLLWDHKHIEWSVPVACSLSWEDNPSMLLLQAASPSKQPIPVVFSFQTFDGSVFAAEAEVPAKPGRVEIPLSHFQRIETGRIQSNPSFLPVDTGFTCPSPSLQPEDIQLFQFRLGPGMTQAEKEKRIQIQISKAWLE